MQFQLLPSCPVTPSCRPFHPLFATPEHCHLQRSSFVIPLLTARQADSRPLCAHQAFCHVGMQGLRKRYNFKLHQHAQPIATLPFGSKHEWVKENEDARMTQWHTSVTSSISLSHTVAHFSQRGCRSVNKRMKHQASWGRR